jgi:hypothetical protein
LKVEQAFAKASGKEQFFDLLKIGLLRPLLFENLKKLMRTWQEDMLAQNLANYR